LSGWRFFLACRQFPPFTFAPLRLTVGTRPGGASGASRNGGSAHVALAAQCADASARLAEPDPAALLRNVD